ncbi:glycosyltransferase [Tengunoibacter tsumagoiensis]|uniref:Glycosyltransferase 2-like domain-containing protein n=1 Tax=Tengunoibacter tsumagoiensis TaxID=2014871 RepID=A0A402A0S4_9CHLR|nr:glycosyltransferase [Tengunoibacter tsumagoiensis]GCE12659.1 hypothetical protein KTT_25180 [Tengunoibacter tsumagoiensis]
MAIQLQDRTERKLPTGSFTPVRIIEIELAQTDLPVIAAIDEQSQRDYRQALCVVRLHTYPVGIVEVALPPGGLEPSQYLPIIWQALKERINSHLQQDGFPMIETLPLCGPTIEGTAPCIEAREHFVDHPDTPFVSVIVPTHDRPTRLANCLRALVGLHYPHFEIIVVDNAPSDNATADLVQQEFASHPLIRYVREEQQGVSWARNCGMWMARGSILAFVDDDVVVDQYWLVEMVRPFTLFKDVACVSGLVLPLKLDTPAQLWFEAYGGFNRGFVRKLFDLKDHRDPSFVYPYHAGALGAGGGSMAFTAQFLLGKGGFDTVLGGNGAIRSGEDMEVFFQVIKQGHILVYEPAAMAYHLHRTDYAALCKQIRGYGMSLSGYLTKCIIDDPLLLMDLLPRIPYGLLCMVLAKLKQNARFQRHKQGQGYPQELTTIELKGLLAGPFAYVKSLQQAKK